MHTKIQYRYKLNHENKHLIATQNQIQPKESFHCTPIYSQIMVDLLKNINKLIVIINVVWRYSVFLQCIAPK